MTMHTRRAWLAGLAVAGLAAATPQAEGAKATRAASKGAHAAAKGLHKPAKKLTAKTCSVPVSRQSFEQYTKLFSAYDPAFLKYYADDVVLEIGARAQLVGKQAIWDHFGELRENFAETMKLLWFCSDANGVAVEMEGSYRCIKDIADSKLFNRSLQRGDVRTFRGVVLYSLEKGKFSRIRGPKPDVIADWHMEEMQATPTDQ